MGCKFPTSDSQGFLEDDHRPFHPFHPHVAQLFPMAVHKAGPHICNPEFSPNIENKTPRIGLFHLGK
jgi:hypothetical protein